MNALRRLGFAAGWMYFAFIAASLVVICAGVAFGLGLLVYEFVR